MRKGKVIIFSAPSGSGKTTIVKRLLKRFPSLTFSISATTREKRPLESDGYDYHFYSPEDFEKMIRSGELIEWEEVYPGKYYGTLKSEIEQIWKNGKHAVFDVDVKGGLNLKSYFGDQALAVFIRVNSREVLRKRLLARNSDSEESIKIRIEKAAKENLLADQFDAIIVNDKLETALQEAEELVQDFIGESIDKA